MRCEPGFSLIVFVVVDDSFILLKSHSHRRLFQHIKLMEPNARKQVKDLSDVFKLCTFGANFPL